MTRSHIARWTLIVSASVLACSDSNEPSIAGEYIATTLRITPAGEPAIDVLAGGGSLTLNIDAQNQVTGNLSVPPSIGEGINSSIAGTAVITGSTVHFEDETNDTFVEDLTFTIDGTQLRADQTLAFGTRYEVVLTSQ